MKRVKFSGYGPPIPLEDLPDPGASALPPILLNLPNGSVFTKATYLEMGFTHYEVWCVGAAGGRGGKASEPAYGGAGGGGGVHYVNGRLATLPEECSVVVGLAGTDGRESNTTASNSYYKHILPGLPGGEVAHDTGARPLIIKGVKYINADGTMVSPYILFPDTGYIVVINPNWRPATPGTDGGASSFNVDTCKASGGKGGQPCPREYYLDNRLVTGGEKNVGDGGEGGIGGRTLVGGGAKGGYAVLKAPYPNTIIEYHDPIDGTWDGAIGEGGGGGRGGIFLSYWNPTSGYSLPDVLVLATNGGMGSFSYANTSYSGAKGLRELDATSQAIVPGEFGGAKKAIIPGAGGSVKIGLLLYGSRAAGYSPNGAVIVRLTKHK